jgi:hypothetical protein
LPVDHLARFIVDVVVQLDLSTFYTHYGKRGGAAYAPEVLLGLLLYGYATGVWSIAQNRAWNLRERGVSLHRRQSASRSRYLGKRIAQSFLQELKDLFVQVLMLAESGQAC